MRTRSLTLSDVLGQARRLLLSLGVAPMGWGLGIFLPCLAASILVVLGTGAAVTRLVSDPAGTEPWQVLLVVSGAGLLLVGLLGALVLLLGAGVLPAVAAKDREESPTAQDILRFGSAYAPAALRLGAAGVGALLAGVGLPLLPIGAVLHLALGTDAMSSAIVWVLLILLAALVAVIAGVYLFVRYVLAWPIVMLDWQSTGPGLKQAKARSRGHVGLTFSLGAVLTSLFCVMSLALAALVPSPQIVDLSAAQLAAQLPQLIRAQVWVQLGASVAACVVGAYAAACVFVLYRATGEE